MGGREAAAESWLEAEPLVCVGPLKGSNSISTCMSSPSTSRTGKLLVLYTCPLPIA